MGQLLAKAYGELTTHVADQKHAVCQMANGKLAMLITDSNGRAGGTTENRVHVYIANQFRTTSTLSQYFAYSNTNADTHPWWGKASMAIDSAGNLHIAYVWYEGTAGAQSVRYRKLSYNSGTDSFTVGAESIVSAAVTNRIVTGIDIDTVCNSTDYPMVIASYRSGMTTYTPTLVAYNKTAASWNALTIRTGAAQNLTNPDICLSVRQSAEVGTAFQYVIAYGSGPYSSGSDQGDFVYLGRANVGGIFVASSLVTVYSGLHKNYNAGYRAWDVFWLGSDAFFLHCVVRSNTHLAWHAIIKTSPTGSAWTVGSAPRSVSRTNARHYRFGRKFSASSLIKYSGVANLYSVVNFNLTAAGIYATTFEVELVGADWVVRDTKQHSHWSRGYTVATNFLTAWAGDRGRNGASWNVDVMTSHTLANSKTVIQKVYLWKKPSLPITTIALPAQNATVATNTPDVTTSVMGVGADAAAIRSRVQVEVSTSNSFASEVFTITQPVTLEAYYSSTSVAVKQALTNYPLRQAKWYLRARMIDQFGQTSAWSTVRTFNISHPPSVTNFSPADNSVLVYNTAGSTFNWKFTDAYAKDVQIAYQIDIYDDETNGLVTSTGKIASAAQSAAVVIPGGSIDHNLDWFVTVWDGDDVSSGALPGGTVFLTEPPNPIIDYPSLDGEDVSTASPAITWLSGITSVKTQVSYRIQLRASDMTLLHDTGIVLSDAATWIVPAGILRNNKSYRIDLTIRDSAGLDATRTRLFDAVWVNPVTLSRPDVYLDNYDTDGFATIVASTAGRDVDLIAFHLYRRRMEQGAAWELIHTITTSTPFIIFKDYLLPAGVTSEYALTQIVDRFDDVIESSLALSPKFQINPQNGHYFLIDTTDLEKSIRISNVTTDSWTDEIEETTYTVIGRGRQVEVGEHVGITGSLNAQLRNIDSGAFYAENYNYLQNPNLETDASEAVTGWTFTNSGPTGVGSLENDVLASGPANRRSGRLAFVFERTGVTSGSAVCSLSQTISKTPYFPMTAGTSYFVSFWVSIPAATAGYTLQLKLEWKEGATVRSSFVQTMSTDTAVVSAGSVLETKVVNGTLWYRVGRPVVVPNGWPLLDNAVFSIQAFTPTDTTARPPLTMYIEGATFTLGGQPVRYFSGYENSGEWTGIENVDPSFTQGSFTARKQRQLIMEAQENQHDLKLRNPFGDVFTVHLSSMQIDRVPGVSNAEFVDVGIPYFQLRDDV